MKKLILANLVLIFASGITFGQKIQNINDEEISAPKHPFYEKVNKSTDPYSAWYNAYTRVDEIGSGTHHYHRLFPDTNVKEIFSSGPMGSRFISKGQVMDPTSPMWKFLDVQVSEREPYVLDSLAIRIAYFRRIFTTPPDTLLVQLYHSNQMEYFESFKSEPFNYCKPTYNPQTQKGENASKEYKVVLTPALEYDGDPKIALLDVDFEVPAGEEVAVSLHFIPAHAYKVGDTLRDWTNNGNGNVNYVGVFLFQDFGKVYYEGHYNHALEVFGQALTFNQKVADFAMDFAPAILRNSGWHTDISFKFTFRDYVGIDDDQDKRSLNFFPNPATNEIRLHGFPNQQEVVIYDRLGQIVLSEIPNGEGILDISKLSSGMYFINMGNKSERLIVH